MQPTSQELCAPVGQLRQAQGTEVGSAREPAGVPGGHRLGAATWYLSRALGWLHVDGATGCWTEARWPSPPSCTCQASSSPPFQADAQVCGSPPRSDSLHRYLLTTGCTCLIGCSLVHPHKNPEQRGSPASHFTDEAASAPGGAATRPTSQDRARSPGLSESNGVRAVSSCGYGCPTRGLLTLERRRARRPRPAPRKSEFSHARIPATQEPRSPPAWAQTDGALQGCCTRARQPLCPLEGQPLPRRQGGRALGSHSDRGRQPDHGVASQWACHQAAGQDIAVILP